MTLLPNDDEEKPGGALAVGNRVHAPPAAHVRAGEERLRLARLGITDAELVAGVRQAVAEEVGGLVQLRGDHSPQDELARVRPLRVREHRSRRNGQVVGQVVGRLDLRLGLGARRHPWRRAIRARLLVAAASSATHDPD
jgi:hypothetical protein